ncbi:cysteine hydrolase family protein [Meiothermus hypogaeus]|uniref:Isochorismatase n=2 Tax=Meiothermus hypogaeus TaxID=884155 RepID=A0A511R7U9_9DEIN|nr:cysteine hydrolase family protein [Meiothermus hypogaeus]RIH74532.1 Streptothricin hydrolase [Meiothermus hypogaeus]GEM85036.1 isochorismatase [Meiothermus hypogaeus NBRC 106114]GIW36653.1 MAG: isochorismatase [Meiothermus sp.]
MSRTALLLIDIQQGLDDTAYFGPRNNPLFERNVAALLEKFRQAGAPVLHVQHHSLRPTSPLRPGQPGHDFKPEARPLEGEPVFAKTVNSAFIGTDLEAYLHREGIARLVVAGLTTDHCVSTTVRMAGNLGFEVWLVGDACATFAKQSPEGMIPADEVHRVHLASLEGEFCTVVSTQEALERDGA